MLSSYTADQEMDGEAICTALATCPGPDSLREVIPKLGVRLKVYRVIRSALEKQYNVGCFIHVLLVLITSTLSMKDESPRSAVVANTGDTVLAPTSNSGRSGTSGYPHSGSTVTLFSSPESVRAIQVHVYLWSAEVKSCTCAMLGCGILLSRC